MTWFSLKDQKPSSWVIFDHFWLFLPDNVFQKIQLSHITIDGPLTACWVSGKNSESVTRKLTHRWKDERKDRHNLFFRTIMVAASSPPPPLILGRPEQKLEFGGELNLRGDLKLVVLKDILLCLFGFRFIYIVYISWYYIIDVSNLLLPPTC